MLKLFVLLQQQQKKQMQLQLYLTKKQMEQLEQQTQILLLEYIKQLNKKIKEDLTKNKKYDILNK